MISISCLWSYGKILFLAKVIASQRSTPMCNCIARAIFNRALKIKSKILSSTFFCNHPETFEISLRGRSHIT